MNILNKMNMEKDNTIRNLYIIKEGKQTSIPYEELSEQIEWHRIYDVWSSKRDKFFHINGKHIDSAIRSLSIDNPEKIFIRSFRGGAA